MRKWLALFLALLATPALAQTGTNKTAAQLNTEIGTTGCSQPTCLWPDNTTGLITPFDLRQVGLDIIASLPSLQGNNTFTGTNAFAAVTGTSFDGLAITTTTGTLTIANGKTLTDTSGVGADLLLGAAGGGYAAYGGASCTNQAITVLSAAGAPTCSTITGGFLASNTVALSNIVQDAMAWSFLGNASDSTANYAPFAPSSLTAKTTPTGSDVIIIADAAASGALKQTTLAEAIAPFSSGVSSFGTLTGAITAGFGLSCVTSTCAVSLTQATNVLSGDVALNNTSNYFDGPSMAQGTTGTWFASGSVTLEDTTGGGNFNCKLWDGTTVIASGNANEVSPATNAIVLHLSGYLASPAANIRISCNDSTHTTGKMVFNVSGNSKDSSIFGIRIQ